MSARRALLNTAASYLRRHPEELSRVLRNAVGLRFGVPIEGLRWLASKDGSGGPRDLEIDSEPPGIRLAATLDLMGTKVRASASVFIERIRASAEEFRIELRLERPDLHVLGGGESPVSALIRSGALDLTKSGSVAAHMPKLGRLLGESEGNRLVIDLFKHPKLGTKTVRRAMGLVSSVLTVHGVESDDGHLDVLLRAFPQGVKGAARAVRDHLLIDRPLWFKAILPARGSSTTKPGY